MIVIHQGLLQKKLKSLLLLQLFLKLDFLTEVSHFLFAEFDATLGYTVQSKKPTVLRAALNNLHLPQIITFLLILYKDYACLSIELTF